MGFFFGVPRVPSGTVSRRRLTERLNVDSALMVVRGGPGIGKTVAVAEWATRRSERAGSRPGIWFTIDTESSSRFALWVALLQQMVDSGLVTRDSVEPLIAAIESTGTLRRQISLVLSRLPDGVIVVIDNAHLIDDTDSPQLLLDIAAVLQATPKLRVVVITHGELELERGHHGVTLGTDVMSTVELSLTVAEIAEVMKQAGVGGSLKSLSSDLHATTAGHPLLVRGALLAEKRGLVSPSLTGGPRMAAAATAAVREVAMESEWSAKEIDFALTTSIADYLSVPLAIELSGRNDAEALLDYLESIGMGMWEMDAETPAFVYVPVLKAELRRTLGERDPERVSMLHRVAARWSFKRGKVSAAIEHAVASGELDLAEAFLFRDWSELTRLHGAKVREVLGGLSKMQLSRHPLIAMSLAIATVASPAQKHIAYELFALAASSAQRGSKSARGHRRMLLLSVSSIAQRLIGDHTGSLESARCAIAAYEALSLAERDELTAIRASLFTHVGLSAHHAGDFEFALRNYAVAATATESARSFTGLGGLALQTGLLAGLGRMNEAAPLLARARNATWPPGWLTGYTGTYIQLAEAYFAIEDRDFARAHGHLDALAAHMPNVEHWEAITRVRAWVLLGEGRAAEAAAVLRAKLRSHGRQLAGIRRSLYSANLAFCEVASGNAAAADLIIRRQPPGQPLTAVAAALLGLSRGSASAALAALDRLDRSALMSVHALGNAYMVRSAALLRQEGEAEALLSLREAVALMTTHGAYTIPLMIPHSDLDALTSAARLAGLQREVAVLERALDQPEVFAPMQPSVQLSEREDVVLQELARFSSNAKIAESLFVSTNTVKSQLRSLYGKLGVGSRADALFEARRRGLID